MDERKLLLGLGQRDYLGPLWRELYARTEQIGKFQTSPDFRVSDDVVVEPGKSVLVPSDVSLGNFLAGKFNLEELKTMSCFPFIHPSLRSRVAQLGLHVDEWELGTELGDGTNLALFRLRNFGQATIALKAGDAFGCLYSSAGAELLTDDALEAEIGQGIRLIGERGKDWDIEYDRTSQGFERLAIRFKVDSRRWVVGPQRKPIRITDRDIVDYRKFLAEYNILTEATDTQITPFWVGQTTARLELDPSINLIISPFIAFAFDSSVLHTSSQFIKGGQTPNWPIRLEFFTENGLAIPRRDLWVSMFAYRNREN